MGFAPCNGKTRHASSVSSKGWRRFIYVWWLALGLLCGSACWAGQGAPAPASSTADAALEPGNGGAPVVVWNRTIATFHATFRGKTATERAQGASERLAQALDMLQPDDISAEWTQSGGDAGMAIRTKGTALFAIFSGDTSAGTQAAAEAEGQLAAARLKQTLIDRAVADKPMIIARGAAFAVLATVLLGIVWWVLIRLDRRVQKRLVAIAEARLKLNMAGFDLRPIVWGLLRWLAGLVKLGIMLFFAYLWLSFVLRLFPYSRPWGQRLGEYLVDLMKGMGAALIHQIPKLITLLVIYLIARGAVRLVGTWFDGVERGSIEVNWIDASTAGITRRLLSIFIWLFALIVAYPYIPGAGTDAFKGVSVFLGLMLSLGSAGVVNQAVSGLVVLYSRTIRVGDFVKVGDHVGVIREMGTLSMKLVTRTRMEVSVPNALLSSSPVCNFTRQSRESGLLLTTSVTIGYDTPWRQVVAMLELAAFRTPGLEANPRPFVLQTALSDFYAEYQLNVALMNPQEQPRVLSELHQNIQDAFNEFGVQIMSPHFRGQPGEKVWTPREHWFDSPAQRPSGPAAQRPSDAGTFGDEGKDK